MKPFKEKKSKTLFNGTEYCCIVGYPCAMDQIDHDLTPDNTVFYIKCIAFYINHSVV